MRHPPDRAVAVFGEQQRAVMRDRDANGPSPHRGIIDDKAGDKILVFAGGDAVLETNADDLVAGAFRPVPRAMFGREPIAAIFAWKRAAIVECEPQRGRVRLDQDVGYADLALQIAPLAGVP